MNQTLLPNLYGDEQWVARGQEVDIIVSKLPDTDPTPGTDDSGGADDKGDKGGTGSQDDQDNAGDKGNKGGTSDGTDGATAGKTIANTGDNGCSVAYVTSSIVLAALLVFLFAKISAKKRQKKYNN